MKNVIEEIEKIKAQIVECKKRKPAGFELRRMLQICSEPEYIKNKLKELGMIDK